MAIAMLRPYVNNGRGYLMIKKLFAWLARNELASLHSRNLQLQREIEEYKSRSHSYLEKDLTKLKNEYSKLEGKLKEANKFSNLVHQLRSHALFLERFEAQETRKTAGLQHVILWAIDADRELRFLTNGDTKEYRELRHRLVRVFNAYGIQGLEE